MKIINRIKAAWKFGKQIEGLESFRRGSFTTLDDGRSIAPGHFALNLNNDIVPVYCKSASGGMIDVFLPTDGFQTFRAARAAIEPSICGVIEFNAARHAEVLAGIKSAAAAATKALHRELPPPIQRGTWAPEDPMKYDAARVKAETAAEAVPRLAQPTAAASAPLNRAQRRLEGKAKAAPSAAREAEVASFWGLWRGACWGFDFPSAEAHARRGLEDWYAEQVALGFVIWNGEPVAGRLTIVLPYTRDGCYWGYGDIFLFCRFFRLARERCETLTIVMDEDKSRNWAGVGALITRMLPGVELRAFNEIIGHTRRFVSPITLMHYSAPSAASLASASPYLAPDAEKAVRWRETLRSYAPKGRRIGVCWAANLADRTMRLADLAPLLGLRRVTLFSLQKGPAEAELAAWEHGARVVNLAPLIADFDDTAAIIAGLDAVVTVDTSIANLAGALGASVHVLLSADADWRWGKRAVSTPWYPTARLWRDAPGRTRVETVRRMVATLADGSIEPKRRAA